jgi:prepilin-type N-terminal cleavage/methylation domain-containing protein
VRAADRKTERGFSLLEASLAMAILASLSAGIFVVTRSQQDGFSMVLSDLRGLQQADEALSGLLKDMSAASAFTVNATDSLDFTPAGGGTATLRLGPAIADDPRNRPLLYDPDGPGPTAAYALTKARVLQNHNPSGLTLQGAAPDGTVPLFTANAPRRVTITLVLQARQATPVRYLRTSVARRNGL